MRLDKIITRNRVIDLASADMRGALKELLSVSLAKVGGVKAEKILQGLLQRENTMTTYLGLGVALPHVRVKIGRKYILALGRSRAGIQYDGAKSEESAHLVFMLLADESARDYLQVLAAIAHLAQDERFLKHLVQAPTIGDMQERLFEALGGLKAEPVQTARQNRTNRLMIKEAERVAVGTGCATIMVFGDTFTGGLPDDGWFTKAKTLLVTRNVVEIGDDKGSGGVENIQVRSYSPDRLAQLRSAMLVALTRGLIKFNDRVCCLGGVSGSNQFDTLVVVDVEREFQALLTARQADLLPEDVKPEVLERVIALAMELAVEGREGRPVGCLFVVGDTHNVEKLTKPLVLNPFYGYKEEDRNILNPFMGETVKEFSSIDGAFVIRGDGVVVSAGSLLQATDYEHSLPSGLGSRHAAAAAISAAAKCISITVSSSTGQVSLFRHGVMLPLTEKKGMAQ